MVALAVGSSSSRLIGATSSKTTGVASLRVIGTTSSSYKSRLILSKGRIGSNLFLFDVNWASLLWEICRRYVLYDFVLLLCLRVLGGKWRPGIENTFLLLVYHLAIRFLSSTPKNL